MKNSALGKAKWSVLAMVASLLLLIALPAKGAVLLYAFMFYLCTFIALHIFLGKAASQSGRSWIYFGLLPVLWPAMGGIISYLILSRKVKNENP